MSEGRNVLYKCRRQGRLFCLLLCVLVGITSQAQSPATTTISDTVYRADGTPAAGTLLISWPTFSTAAGQAVASGTKSVTWDGRGVIGRTCAQCRRRTSEHVLHRRISTKRRHREDRILVSRNTVSDHRVAAVRATPGSGSSAAPPATKQYVDAAVATKANDSAVVHLSGAETITEQSSLRWRRACRLPCRAGTL